MKKVGFIAHNDTAFVERDIEVIGKYYETRAVYGVPDHHSPLGMTAKVTEIIQVVRWADVLVLWFADWHSYIASTVASVLDKPIITVVGGYDVASIDEIDYGGLNTERGHSRNNYIFQSSDRILPVSTGLKQDLLTHFNLDERKVQVVPLGFDHEKYYPQSNVERSGVLTVALADAETTLRVKGLDHYSEIAKQFPESEFVVVGVSDAAKDILEADQPKNLRLVGPVKHNELLHYYQEASVYCQLSMREGFGSALAEAMLCGCIPVGYDVQGVANLVAGVGHLVPTREPENAIDSVTKALSGDAEQRKSVRDFIKQNFSREKRGLDIKNIIKSL